MEHLVPLLDSSKDRYCIFNGWLIHHNWLETSLKSRILLYILSVLVQCCGTYTVQLTSGEHRLKHVSRIHCTISLACSDDSVKLIDEHNHFTLRLLNLIKDILKSLFKFTTILCTCYKSTHIKCKYLLVLKSLWYITSEYPLCKSLYNRSLTYTRLTDKHRIVLCLP